MFKEIIATYKIITSYKAEGSLNIWLKFALVSFRILTIGPVDIHFQRFRVVDKFELLEVSWQ